MSVYRLTIGVDQRLVEHWACGDCQIGVGAQRIPQCTRQPERAVCAWETPSIVNRQPKAVHFQQRNGMLNSPTCATIDER